MSNSFIEVNKVVPVGEDSRGPTYEWQKGIPGLQLTVCKRHEGVIAGNHYHKGDDLSKNPEKLFLINGNFMLTASNDFTGERLERVIQEGDELIIYPGVLHSFKALTDITFVEYRATVFDRNFPDTYLEDTYKDYVESLKRIRG